MGIFKIQRGRKFVFPNPWPDNATLISNATDLTTAIRSGPDGTHYLLAPGDYGAYDPGFQPRYTKPAGSSPVHIWGQPGVTFTSVNISSGKFIHFHYISTTGGSYGFTAGSCTDVGFDHCYSINATTHGFHFQNSTNVFATWCKAENTSNPFVANLVTGLTWTDVWAENYQDDAFDVFGVTGGAIARCLARTPALGDPNAHPDSFQLAAYQTTRNTDITISDVNFDRNGGTQTNGPVFSSGGDRLTWTNIAAFGCNNNGVSLADMTDSTVTNAFVQGYDYPPAGVIRGGSTNCSLINVQACGPCADYQPYDTTTTPPTPILPWPSGSTYTNCTTIPQATSASDRALYEAFLAANPTIPTTAHWANAGYI